MKSQRQLPNLSNPSWFYLLGVPLGWAGVSLLHFRWPGDEYAMWAISSMAGVWVLLFAPNVGDIHQWWVRGAVALVGFLVMGGAGWLVYWLKVRVRIWLAVWLSSVVGWLGFMLMQYPSIERALAKNGSWAAYLCTAILMAVNSATILGIVGGGIKHFSKKGRPASVPASSPGAMDVS